MEYTLGPAHLAILAGIGIVGCAAETSDDELDDAEPSSAFAAEDTAETDTETEVETVGQGYTAPPPCVKIARVSYVILNELGFETRYEVRNDCKKDYSVTVAVPRWRDPRCQTIRAGRRGVFYSMLGGRARRVRLC
jgi:hypothetical protein